MIRATGVLLAFHPQVPQLSVALLVLSSNPSPVPDTRQPTLQVPSPDLVTLCPFFSEDLEPETPPSPQMPLAVQWSLRETLAHLPVSTGGDVR